MCTCTHERNASPTNCSLVLLLVNILCYDYHHRRSNTRLTWAGVRGDFDRNGNPILQQRLGPGRDARGAGSKEVQACGHRRTIAGVLAAVAGSGARAGPGEQASTQLRARVVAYGNAKACVKG